MKVAGRVRVSVGTVSRVLNNDIRVAPDARDRVSGVICELGCVAKLGDYIGTLTNTSFPLVLIDHQGTGSRCADVGTRYGVPAIAFPFALEEMR